MPNFKKNPSPAMKKSAYKMKGYSYPGTSPIKKGKAKQDYRESSLLKAVPNKEAYDKLSAEDKKGFDAAAKKAGFPTKKNKT